tara:strand:- start:173 stop:583 length:411 start_codon:yes stop_codon:yes gene_type:complete
MRRFYLSKDEDNSPREGEDSILISMGAISSLFDELGYRSKGLFKERFKLEPESQDIEIMVSNFCRQQAGYAITLVQRRTFQNDNENNVPYLSDIELTIDYSSGIEDEYSSDLSRKIQEIIKVHTGVKKSSDKDFGF